MHINTFLFIASKRAPKKLINKIIFSKQEKQMKKEEDHFTNSQHRRIGEKMHNANVSTISIFHLL